MREEEKEQWARESNVSETIDLSVQRNAAALGRVQQITMLLDLDYLELAAGLEYRINEGENEPS